MARILSLEEGTVDDERRINDIKKFWDAQAETHGTDASATTPDIWLRELEIASISQVLGDLLAGQHILDVGCGNGFSTIRLAEEHPQHTFVGGDYSPAMVASAERALAGHPELRDRVRFQVADVLALDPLGAFDVVLSDRCLINLPSFELQRQAVDQIAGVLRPGGRYVAIENFVGPHERFNVERERLGLAPIPFRWHNVYLDEDAFIAACARSMDFLDSAPISSTYYLVTRLVYSKLCQLEGVEPAYDHPIHEIAATLPATGDLGPIKMLQFARRTEG